MTLTVERFDARVWPDDVIAALFSDGFPAFITADPVAAAYIGRIREWFAEHEIVLIEGGEPVACGWGVPIYWDGSVIDLPSGYTGTTRRAVEGRIHGVKPDTFVICAGLVHPKHAGRGLAGQLIEALRDRSMLPNVIAPLRPTLKSTYPLTPIETYATWKRPDGTALDPWLRTHLRLGARVLAVAPHSQTMTGTVEQWESWTGMRLPSTGAYVIPDGLSPLYIDREANLGTYTEPNIWVQHR
ncbi:MAG TPA: GNAT family N-acetyltransferase [Micromonosporaceae bacterium]|jgi:GNAT superfamily N-acetyltransferase